MNVFEYEAEGWNPEQSEPNIGKGRSTGDLLAILTESWSSSFGNFGETFVVALDISKAFDSLAQIFNL